MQKYWQLMKLAFINRLDYRQELVMSLFIGVIIFAGQAIFWGAAFQGKEMINGFNYLQILTYYLFARIVSEIIDSRVGFRINLRVIDGQVTSFLLKPARVQLWLFFEELGQILVDTILKAGVYLLIFILVFGKIIVAYENLPLFFLSVGLSLIISFSIFLMAGCIAFWVESSISLNHMLKRIILFLAGGLVPVAFFPDSFQKIMQFLPFLYMFDLPIKILTAKIDLAATIQGLGVQLFWAVFLWIISARLLKFAIKNNESVGI